MKETTSSIDSKSIWQRLLTLLTIICCGSIAAARFITQAALETAAVDTGFVILGAVLQTIIFKDRLFAGSELMRLSKAGERQVILLGIRLVDQHKFKDTISRLGGASACLRIALALALLLAALKAAGSMVPTASLALCVTITLSATPGLMLGPLFLSNILVAWALAASDRMNSPGGLVLMALSFIASLVFVCLHSFYDQAARLHGERPLTMKVTHTLSNSVFIFLAASAIIFALLPKHHPARPPAAASGMSAPRITHMQGASGGRSSAAHLPAAREQAAADLLLPERRNNNDQVPGDLQSDVRSGAQRSSTGEASETGAALPSGTERTAPLRQGEEGLIEKVLPRQQGGTEHQSGTESAGNAGSQRNADGLETVPPSMGAKPGFSSATSAPQASAPKKPKLKRQLHLQHFWKYLLPALAAVVFMFFLLRRSGRSRSGNRQQRTAPSSAERSSLTHEFKNHLASLVQKPLADAEAARSQVIRIYHLLLIHLAKCGLTKSESETPDEYALQGILLNSPFAEPMHEVTEVFCKACYGNLTPSPAAYRRFIENTMLLGTKIPYFNFKK
jgi:hypothetical protein